MRSVHSIATMNDSISFGQTENLVVSDRLSPATSESDQSGDLNNPYISYITASFIAFSVINYTTSNLGVPSHLDTPHSKWKWTNTMTSLVHSTLTGVWALWSIGQNPSLASDIIRGFSQSTHMLGCVSAGYFCYDFMDMALYTWHKRSTKELLVHHVAVLVPFLMAASSRTYVSAMTMALFTEVNSIFLHARTLLKMAGLSSAFSYQAVAWLNLLTYMVFRILLFVWFTHKMALIRHELPTSTFAIFFAGFTSVVILSLVNLFRLIKSDFLPHQRQ